MTDIQTLFDSDEAENEYMKEQEARRLKAEEKKQIEEMAHDLCGRCQDGICVVDGKPCNLDLDCTCQINATTLYNAGYRKQSEGEWIIKGDYLKIMECSACGMMSASIHEKTRFCPNCGARMKGGE